VSAIFILNTQVAVALLSTIRDLHRRRARERRALTLVEGVRLLEEALAASVEIRGAAIGPGLEATSRGQALKRRLADAGVPLEQVDDGELARLADTEQPQGIVAVVALKGWSPGDLVLGPRSVILGLDGIQEPGNVGALARAALGLGASGLVALPGTADLLNPKALRGSMGAMFRLPSVRMTVEAFLDWTRSGGIAIWVAATDGAPVLRPRPPAPVMLVVGNEGAGVRPEVAEAAARVVAVPLKGGVESLNVAVAAGILLYEVTRDG
jgi:TrmH family RNA methyltransferase